MRYLHVLCVLLLACSPKATPTVTPGAGADVPDASSADQPEEAVEGDDALGGRQLTGLFRIADGKYEFRPCEAPTKRYWVLGPLSELDERYADATLQGYPGQNVVATLTGALVQPRSSRGAAQSSPYDAQFRVTSIDRVRAKNPRNACPPADFWGAGNEPFWSLQISEAEGVIELSQVGAPTVAFPYVEPVVAKGGAETSYITEGTEQRLKVRVYAEECLDDMAGNRYTHRMEVTYKGQVLKGCANGGAFE